MFPLMLLLKEELAVPEAAALIGRLRAQADALATAGSLLESLPLRMQRRLRKRDPTALDDLPPAERERFLREASAVHLDRQPPAAPSPGN
jgi:hypothetical protein